MHAHEQVSGSSGGQTTAHALGIPRYSQIKITCLLINIDE